MIRVSDQPLVLELSFILPWMRSSLMLLIVTIFQCLLVSWKLATSEVVSWAPLLIYAILVGGVLILIGYSLRLLPVQATRFRSWIPVVGGLRRAMLLIGLLYESTPLVIRSSAQLVGLYREGYASLLISLGFYLLLVLITAIYSLDIRGGHLREAR